MTVLKDPETGFYNTCHAGTTSLGPRTGLPSFVTPHAHVMMQKYRDLGQDECRSRWCSACHPAYEIMANFSGLHMDIWGELEMVGTVMDQDVEMVACETIPMNVPAHAEIVVEGWVDIGNVRRRRRVVALDATTCRRPRRSPRCAVTAITMREDRPIYRNHLTCPDTDHQPLPRLCHEAVLYNRLTEIGLTVHDVHFPTWGAAVSCILQFEYPREGFVNDALMQCDGLALAEHQDGGGDQPRHRHRRSRRRLPRDRDALRPGARHDHRAQHPRLAVRPGGGAARRHDPHWRTVGKIGIDATVKSRHDVRDFERRWPKNWGKVRLEDYM